MKNPGTETQKALCKLNNTMKIGTLKLFEFEKYFSNSNDEAGLSLSKTI